MKTTAVLSFGWLLLGSASCGLAAAVPSQPQTSRLANRPESSHFTEIMTLHGISPETLERASKMPKEAPDLDQAPRAGAMNKTLEKRDVTPFSTDMTKWGGRLAPISDEDFCIHTRAMEWLAHRLVLEVKDMKPPHNITGPRPGLSNQPADNHVYLVAKLMRIWLQLMRVLNLQIEWSLGLPGQNHCAVCYAGYAMKASQFLMAITDQAHYFYLRDPVRSLIGELLKDLEEESKTLAWILLLRPRGTFFSARQAQRTENIWGDKMFRLYGTKPGHHLSKFLKRVEPHRSDRWLRGGLFRTARKAWHFEHIKPVPSKMKRQWPPYEPTNRIFYNEMEVLEDPDVRVPKESVFPPVLSEPPWDIVRQSVDCVCPYSDVDRHWEEVEKSMCVCQPPKKGKNMRRRSLDSSSQTGDDKAAQHGGTHKAKAYDRRVRRPGKQKTTKARKSKLRPRSIGPKKMEVNKAPLWGQYDELFNDIVSYTEVLELITTEVQMRINNNARYEPLHSECQVLRNMRLALQETPTGFHSLMTISDAEIALERATALYGGKCPKRTWEDNTLEPRVSPDPIEPDAKSERVLECKHLCKANPVMCLPSCMLEPYSDHELQRRHVGRRHGNSTHDSAGRNRTEQIEYAKEVVYKVCHEPRGIMPSLMDIFDPNRIKHREIRCHNLKLELEIMLHPANQTATSPKKPAVEEVVPLP